VKRWLKMLGLLLVIGAVGIGVYWWLHRPAEWQRCYASVRGGMTLDQVRQIMGRGEDAHDNRATATGEFERSWTFAEDGACITVVFARNGSAMYIEYGPSYCGVTPLMGKLVKNEAK
jgi:hypothetical protein